MVSLGFSSSFFNYAIIQLNGVSVTVWQTNGLMGEAIPPAFLPNPQQMPTYVLLDAIQYWGLKVQVYGVYVLISSMHCNLSICSMCQLIFTAWPVAVACSKHLPFFCHEFAVFGFFCIFWNVHKNRIHVRNQTCFSTNLQYLSGVSSNFIKLFCRFN